MDIETSQKQLGFQIRKEETWLSQNQEKRVNKIDKHVSKRFSYMFEHVRLRLPAVGYNLIRNFVS